MSKTKKGLIVAAVIILVAALLPVGLLSFQKWSDETASREAKESAKVDFQAYHTYSNDESGKVVATASSTLNNCLDMWRLSYKDFKSFFEASDSSFLIREADSLNVVAVSKGNFNKTVQKINPACEYDNIIKSLKYLVTEITGRGYTWDGGVSWRMSPTNCPFAGTRHITAFKKSIPLETLKPYKNAQSDQNVIRSEGLRLKISEVSLKKILATSLSSEGQRFVFCVEANADVKTKKKPEQFEDTWIPDVGEQKNVDLIFVIQYDPNESFIQWTVLDIAVKGYN